MRARLLLSLGSLAIEVDGAAHDIPDQAGHDRRRDAWLAEQGIRVLRVLAADVLDEKRRKSVLDTIAAAGRDLGAT